VAKPHQIHLQQHHLRTRSSSNTSR